MSVLIPFGLSFLFAVLLLRVVAGFTPGFELEDWSATMVVALILSVAHELLKFVWPESIDRDAVFPWKLYAAIFVVNVTGLGFASMMVGGVRIRGAGGLIVAAVLVTVLGYAANLGVSQILTLLPESL